MRALEAEQALVGIALYDDSALPLVEHVKPEHFSEPAHGRIWELCCDVVRAGRKVNIAVIRPLLGDLLVPYGEHYLADLYAQAPASSMATQYASAIINAWQVRELALVTQGIATATDAESAASELRAHLDRIELATGAGDDLVDAQAAGGAAFKALEASAETGKGLGLLCGLKCIDERLGGLQRGHLVVLGGRPSMGKTALADNISYGAAHKNPDQTFVFFNLEMDAGELSRRQLSAHAYMMGEYVQYRDLKRPTSAIMRKLAPHKDSLPRNLLICDQKRISVDDVRRIVWKLKAKRSVGAVFIDYLQLMQMPAAKGKTDAKVIAEATAELKRIAGEAQVCIVLLSQLSRGVESRDNRRPMMSDLRDSGGIEQDANAILFPYREHYYLKNDPPKDPNKMPEWTAKLEKLAHVMTVISAKVRDGETGDDELYCSLGYDVVLNEAPYDGVVRMAAE